MDRVKVYEMIDGERDYQDIRWNSNTTSSGGNHSVGEWFIYIEDYIMEAKHILTRLPDPEANTKALKIMRKVAAMAVHAMEQHNTLRRTT